MQTSVVNHKGFVIQTEEGVEKGIFFRKPLQQVGYDAYYDNPLFSAWEYLEAIKNPIRRLYEIIIGNREIINNIHKWAESLDWGGFSANIICFPIYFKRQYRKLSAYSCDDSNIQKIESYGYESQYETCSGCCYIEKTKILLCTGKTIRLIEKNQYHYTYAHLIKDMIDTGEIEG